MFQAPRLTTVDLHQSFKEPSKCIHDGTDVQFFLSSLAYKDIVTFILQLNRAVLPRKRANGQFQTWQLNDVDQNIHSDSVKRLQSLLNSLDALTTDAPPDTGPRRFGNVSFRKWYGLVEGSVDQALCYLAPSEMLVASSELKKYILGSFGSPQRLDYGTGHELSFLAFLGCLWKLGYFNTNDPEAEERALVFGVIQPYLNLIRKLIKMYNLEPAGSHGVWGLDDNSFLPYIFGSAQFSPAIAETDDTPTEGSIPGAPDPSTIVKANEVAREAERNMYFSAIAFIYDVKKGPFWEHSPVLFDISGIKDGWGKINKGMIKMYNAEVLSKFPVVQHFPFGSLFRWEKDPTAKSVRNSTHTSSQPLRAPVGDSLAPSAVRTSSIPTEMANTAAPWVSSQRPVPPPTGFVNGVTQAPWAKRTPARLPVRGGFSPQLRRPDRGVSIGIPPDTGVGNENPSRGIQRPARNNEDRRGGE